MLTCALTAGVRAQATTATQVGEVLVVQGDTEILSRTDNGVGLQALEPVARAVIERYGDRFDTITVWETFNDTSTPTAEAYQVPIRTEVKGLGMTLQDRSATFGSQGVLHSMVNMKSVGLRAGDTRTGWNQALSTWGQEAAHRWLAFFQVRDPRTGLSSDILLGRDCAHYSRFVDTQASVHDGVAWRDNGDGTFTATASNQRYGNLDLYGMGLLPSDEVPAFFFIDDIPGFRHPGCSGYERAAKPTAATIAGSRVDVTIDDIIAANGQRVPSADEQLTGYWREAEVVLTGLTETSDSTVATALAARINQARLWWEEWNHTASGNRIVICTQLSQDCGDARSDPGPVSFNAEAKPTTRESVPVDVMVSNGGSRPATGVTAQLDMTVGDRLITDQQNLGTVAAGAMRAIRFNADLRTLACGTELMVKVTTQSDSHRKRSQDKVWLGTRPRAEDGFEVDSGWTVNPDGDDSSQGAIWEWGEPSATDLFGIPLRPGHAAHGQRAWLTGLNPANPQGLPPFVKGGKTTLQSPVLTLAPLAPNPRLHYQVSFLGGRGDATGRLLVPSPLSRLTVMARSVPDSGAPGPWTTVDHLENQLAGPWTARMAPLPSELTGALHVQLRFVAADDNDRQGGVEVAIDDVGFLVDAPDCAGSSGGPRARSSGCALGSHRSTSAAEGFGLLAALALLALLILRRHARPL